MIVAHNIEFDFKILVNECIREKMFCDWDTMWKFCFCTMKSTKDLCNIPRSHGGGNKYHDLKNYIHIFIKSHLILNYMKHQMMLRYYGSVGISYKQTINYQVIVILQEINFL